MKPNTLIILLAVLLMASFAFAGVTEMKIWTDEMMSPDPDQMNPVTHKVTRYGTKSNPGSYYIVRWCTNAEPASDYMNITGTDPEPAAGPYCMDVGMGPVPAPNLWMDMRRDDAAPGWSDPLDASATERVTFWIKAEPNTCPLWFYALDYPAPSGFKNVSATIRIEGETVVTQDLFGEFLARLTPFNGTWQFVSLPWSFLMLKDSTAVDAVVPYSFVHEGTTYGGADGDGAAYSFTTDILRSLTWATSTTDDGPYGVWDQAYASSPNCKWTLPYARGNTTAPQRWSIDEVVFCLNQGTGIVGVNGNPTVMPLTYDLGNNYPNPFNPTTEIDYAIPVSNQVSIDLFNSLGQKVKTLVDRYLTAGTYHATWDGTDDFGNAMPTGLYYYKMTSSHFNSVKKMLLLK